MLTLKNQNEKLGKQQKESLVGLGKYLKRTDIILFIESYYISDLKKRMSLSEELEEKLLFVRIESITD